MRSIIINSKKFGTKEVFVDDEDHDALSKYKWTASQARSTFYATRTDKLTGKKISMHRHLLGLDFGDTRQGDHVDHNGLNNQKSNLRIATVQQNLRNRVSHGRSKFLGVCFDKSRNKFRAHIKNSGKSIHLGRFELESDAAKAYNDAAIKIHGEFANLNNIKP